MEHLPAASDTSCYVYLDNCGGGSKARVLPITEHELHLLTS